MASIPPSTGGTVTITEQAAAVTWTALAPSGSPDYDVGGVFNNVTDEGSGEYTYSWDRDATGRAGPDDGWTYVFDLPAGYDPQTNFLFIKGTMVSSSVSTSSAWMGVALADNTGNMPAGGACLGFEWYWSGTGNWTGYAQTRTGTLTITDPVNSTNPVEIIIRTPPTFGGGTGQFATMTATDEDSIGTARLTTTPDTNPAKIIICGGTYTGGGALTVTMRMKIEVAVGSYPT
jgi:hypothetical protein